MGAEKQESDIPIPKCDQCSRPATRIEHADIRTQFDASSPPEWVEGLTERSCGQRLCAHHAAIVELAREPLPPPE